MHVDEPDRREPQNQDQCATPRTLTLATLTLIFTSAALIPGTALAAGPMGPGAPMMAPSPGVIPAPKAPVTAPQGPTVVPRAPAPIPASPMTAAPQGFPTAGGGGAPGIADQGQGGVLTSYRTISGNKAGGNGPPAIFDRWGNMIYELRAVI